MEGTRSSDVQEVFLEVTEVNSRLIGSPEYSLASFRLQLVACFVYSNNPRPREAGPEAPILHDYWWTFLPVFVLGPLIGCRVYEPALPTSRA